MEGYVQYSGESVSNMGRRELIQLINSSGCPDITGALSAATHPDTGEVYLDISALREAAEFVLTSPPDTLAAPKK